MECGCNMLSTSGRRAMRGTGVESLAIRADGSEGGTMAFHSGRLISGDMAMTLTVINNRIGT